MVEVDAQDGKNIFYLPKGTDFTAVMNPGEKRTDGQHISIFLFVICLYLSLLSETFSTVFLFI